MDSGKAGAFSRPAGDFIDAETAKKAGILEIRAGASAPVSFGPSFKWPSFPHIKALEYDSREVKPGALYFALRGIHADGHAFVPDAIRRGALAVVHENELDEYLGGTLYIKVKNSRYAMSPIAASFNGSPSRRMGIIGVTGTEGKSTTVYLIYQLLKLMGKKAGFISTVMRGDGLKEIANSEHQTTPEAVTIHSLLSEMYANGAEFAVIESSSHGLSKQTNRLGDVDFDVGVMTTVSHEHLEFHGSWEQYRSDKAELFRSLDTSPSSHKKQGDMQIPSFGVVNSDDASADFFAGVTRRKCYTFSTRGAGADLSIKLIQSGSYGNWYEVFVESSGKTVAIRDRLPGAFNTGNVLAALLVVSNLLSVDVEDLADRIPYLKPVHGRMTMINRGQPFEVIVDYAHTPSSFETIFPPLRERLNLSERKNARGGRLISVFGSAGERDTKKRPLQGEIAARYSDIIILADEDPRGEDPMSILEDIAKGCEAASGCEVHNMVRGENLFIIPDRPIAIRKAFSLARKGDLVLLLGKGHENSIIYASHVINYDETAEAEKALEEAGYNGA